MHTRILIAICSLILACAGIFLPETAFALWLNPVATDDLLDSITRGITLLKGILVADAILLFLIPFSFGNRGNETSKSTLTPLWSPSRTVDSEISNAKLFWF